MFLIPSIFGFIVIWMMCLDHGTFSGIARYMICIQNKISFVLVMLSLLATASAYAEEPSKAYRQRIGSGDPVAGKAKSTLCQGCHGEDGLSVENLIPHLAGQYSGYIEKELRNFQSGARKHQIMSVMAKTINKSDLADIGAYFASQKKMLGGGWGVSPTAKKLFTKGDKARNILACVSCHGANGKGKATNSVIFPVIGGQHKDYLRAQLINWRTGARSNNPDGVMSKIAKSLTEREIELLAVYISGM
jgi:cytochrome c553